MNYIIHGTSCQEIAINHTRVSDPQQIILADVIFMTTWLKHRPGYHDISTSRIISFQHSRCCVGLKNYECAFLFYEVWMHTASCIKSPSRETWPWASYHIRKNADCACAGNVGKVSPRRRRQRKPLVSDPGMHHGTCVTHVPCSCHAYKPTFLNNRSWILLHCTNRASEAWRHDIVIQTLSFLHCKTNFHD